MSQIFTSYYGNWRTLARNHIQIIGISRGNPIPDDIPRLPYLFPTKELLYASKSGEITWDEYVTIYKVQLEALDLAKVSEDLKALLQRYDNIALCCYEKPGKNCHRHLVSNFLNSKLGLNIQEFVDKVEPEFTSITEL